MASATKRCTFAIISHPDAGKTTMTEKLLWFGQVVRQTGKVKSKTGDYAKSDWMELEKQRGISVTTSVMSFPYNNRAMHLLDTPGHKDFSEDTYRTLTAVESVLMMIDSAKGVESQTIKLMEVCRMRDTPVVTFMNKYDRDALAAFDLLENVERICSIQCVPMNWPIGDGVEFKGLYLRQQKEIHLFKSSEDSHAPTVIDASDLGSSAVLKALGESALAKLREDLEILEELIPPLDREEFLAGIQTPVYFGSALYNFGVEQVLDEISTHAPGPSARKAKLAPFDDQASIRMVAPNEQNFSGFIFKIQANMDKNHRDRMAFLRVCSGEFKRGKKIFHVRSGKEIKIAAPVMFQAQDRALTETAYPGDIIGIHDTGKLQIGDTFSDGEKIQFTGIPQFAPEIFMRAELKDPLKAKQLDKGLLQLSEEGAIQLFYRSLGNEKILGAVGKLQFDVAQFRLENEYAVKANYSSVALESMRWAKFPDEKGREAFQNAYPNYFFTDNKGRACFGVRTEWDLKLAMEKYPDVEFFKHSDGLN